MTRRLAAFNLLLIVLIALACWRMRMVWVEREQASIRFFTAPVTPLPAPVVLVPDAPAKVNAVAYFDIAQQLMFSRDRNPTVIVEVVEPKPMPALPLYYGMINWGEGPKVVLAQAQGGVQRSYRPGQQVGDFKLVAIEPAGLVFEWDGKRVARTYGPLRDTKPPNVVRTTTTQSASAQPTPQAPRAAPAATSISGSATTGPAADKGAATRSCQPGDSSPAGTVVDGYRKVLANSPFGQSCYWEKVK